MSSSEKPVLVIGDACVDLMVQVPEKSGSDRQHPPPELHGGGTGANTAVALARLNVATTFMGTIGDDSYGRFARSTLEAEGIGTSYVVTDHHAYTALVLALIDPQGERSLFGWPRRGAAHTQLASEQITFEIFQQVAWLHTTGMCLVESPSREAVLQGMELARATNIPVSFDINLRLGFEDGKLSRRFVETIRQAISLSNYVFGSGMDEIVHLVPTDSIEAAAQLLAEDQRTVIVRLGADGALAVRADRDAVTIPAFPVEVVDTIGAGDAFNAGFIVARIGDRSIEEAVRWGNAVAALKIGRSGARSVPNRSELEEFLNIEPGGKYDNQTTGHV
jgi:sugar/nucleoside kinase (ribokinase family)